jgi:hypothetical protein
MRILVLSVSLLLLHGAAFADGSLVETTPSTQTRTSTPTNANGHGNTASVLHFWIGSFLEYVVQKKLESNVTDALNRAIEHSKPQFELGAPGALMEATFERNLNAEKYTDLEPENLSKTLVGNDVIVMGFGPNAESVAYLYQLQSNLSRATRIGKESLPEDRRLFWVSATNGKFVIKEIDVYKINRQIRTLKANADFLEADSPERINTMLLEKAIDTLAQKGRTAAIRAQAMALMKERDEALSANASVTEELNSELKAAKKSNSVADAIGTFTGAAQVGASVSSQFPSKTSGSVGSELQNIRAKEEILIKSANGDFFRWTKDSGPVPTQHKD